jgi:hypothetical protein
MSIPLGHATNRKTRWAVKIKIHLRVKARRKEPKNTRSGDDNLKKTRGAADEEEQIIQALPLSHLNDLE